MEIVIVLRQLWRQRWLVALAAALAIAVGGLTAYRPSLPPQSRQYAVGLASARALVDTPSSQVVDLGLKEDANAGVLPARAVLLANLLTTSPLKDETARRAGVPPDRLIAVADTPTDAGGPVDKQLATGASVKPSDPDANILTAHTDLSLPLITVNAQAPDPRTAARLANSALAVLEDHLAKLLTDDAVPAERRLVVKKLGAARAGTEQRGPSRLLAIAAGIVIFVLGCVAIVLLSALARDWRAAVALEHPDAEWIPWPSTGDADAGLDLDPPEDEGEGLAGAPRAQDDMVA